MAKEYKVTVDQSLKAENSPTAFEKEDAGARARGLGAKHVTSVVSVAARTS